MRLFRLLAAAACLPVAAVLAFQIALRFNGDTGVIDTVGNSFGLVLLVAMLAGISRIAADYDWMGRLGTSLGLAIAYFAMTWTLYGDPGRSIDEAPHLVWLGVSIAAFSPAVVLMPIARWLWEAFLDSRQPASV